jgi:hypothetical protein
MRVHASGSGAAGSCFRPVRGRLRAFPREGHAEATITGTNGPDTLRGTADADLIRGRGGADGIVGREGDDIILAGLGDDAIGGDNTPLPSGPFGPGEFGPVPPALAGHDSIDGDGGGGDLLDGGRGRDTLFGGSGVDTLVGGGGEDLFVFARNPNIFFLDTGVGPGNRDLVLDFREGLDRLDLSGYRNFFPRRAGNRRRCSSAPTRSKPASRSRCATRWSTAGRWCSSSPPWVRRRTRR